MNNPNSSTGYIPGTQNIILTPSGSGSVITFVTGWVSDVGLLYSDLTIALGINDVKTPIYGYLHHTGTPTGNGVGHGIGGLFRAQDIPNATMPLIGLEGRVDAYGSGFAYGSVAINSTYIGNNFNNRTLYGAVVTALNVFSGDGITPLPEGIVIGYYCPPIIGGAETFSFLANNILRVNSQIQSFDTNGINGIIIYDDGTNGNIQTTAGAIVLAPGNGVVAINGYLVGPFTNGSLLGIAGNAWNITATEITAQSGSFNNIILNGIPFTNSQYYLTQSYSGNSVTIDGTLSNNYERFVLTGSLYVGINGAGDGNKLTIWAIASGNSISQNLTITGIKVPASNIPIFSTTISSGTKTKIVLERDDHLNGGQWELNSCISGF